MCPNFHVVVFGKIDAKMDHDGRWSYFSFCASDSESLIILRMFFSKYVHGDVQNIMKSLVYSGQGSN
jgi:hypothetical protein